MQRLVRSGRLGSMVIGLLAVFELGALARGQGTRPAGFPAPGTAPIVTLASAGAEPRRPIRYAVVNGRKDHLNLDMTMNVAMDMAGMSLPSMLMPTMRMGADMAVTDVSPAGDASYKMTFTDLNWVSSAGVDPSLLAALQAATPDLTALSGSATVSPRGMSRNVTLDASKVANPQIAQMMGSVSSAFQQMALPFPEEAVGVGARWAVRMAVSTGAMQTFQKVDIELVAFDATSCTLKTTTEQTAPRQTVSVPGLPPGVDASLESLSGSGTGTMLIHFDSLAPTSEATMKTATVMSVAMGGDQQRISVQASIQMKLAPVK
jgi:hypothetical protein